MQHPARLPQPLLWEASHSQGPLNLLYFPWAPQTSLGDPEDGLWMHTLGSKSCLHHKANILPLFPHLCGGTAVRMSPPTQGAYKGETLENSEQS